MTTIYRLRPAPLTRRVRNVARHPVWRTLFIVNALGFLVPLFLYGYERISGLLTSPEKWQANPLHAHGPWHYALEAFVLWVPYFGLAPITTILGVVVLARLRTSANLVVFLMLLALQVLLLTLQSTAMGWTTI